MRHLVVGLGMLLSLSGCKTAKMTELESAMQQKSAAIEELKTISGEQKAAIARLERVVQSLTQAREALRKGKDEQIERLIKEREDAVRRQRQLERDIAAERNEMQLKLELTGKTPDAATKAKELETSPLKAGTKPPDADR